MLLKYAAGSLEPAGSVTVAEAPTAPDTSGARERMGPPPPDLALWKDASGAEQLLVVIGGRFVRVDGASMTIKAKTTLPKPPEPEVRDETPPPGDGMRGPDLAGRGPGGPGPGGPGGPPPMMGRGGGGRPMLVVDGIAYFQRGPQVLAVSGADGRVVGAAMLPKPAMPAE